jgi:cytochrome c
MFKRGASAILIALLLSACAQTAPVARYGLGKPLAAEALRGWDIDVRADGAGLPPGAGSVAQGKLIYLAQCASCHGASGTNGTASRLAGGMGSLAGKAPILTVGSYWPYATTLYDYIRRAMPFDKPQSLSAEQVYAVAAYVLHLNGIVGADAVLDERTLPAIAMPNRGGFISDAVQPDGGSKTR